MKKIIFVTNHFQYGDGVSRVLLELVNALDKNKYDITIKVLYNLDKDFVKNLHGDIKIESVFKCYFRGMTRLVQKIPSKLLYNFIVKEKYDIEVAYQFGAPTKIMAFSDNKNAKHICWMHGYDSKMEMLKYYNMYDKVVCVSQSSKTKLEKYLDDPKKAIYLYNVINDKEIKIKATEEIDIKMNYPFTFCTVGRLSKEKGFLRLLRCHKRLLNDGLYHNILIIGDGGERNLLESYIKENNLSETAFLTGLQVNPYKYVDKSDVFVCSSFAEGFSTACTEAIILEKPVISTIVDGAIELIESSNCGIVVKNDEESLYKAMKLAIQDDNIVKEWSKFAKMESENLTSKNRINKIEAFLKQLYL